MVYILMDKKPEKVLHYFEEISAIPHGSRHTKQLGDYLVSFAKDRGLKYVQDKAGNVIIFQKGSADCGNATPVILQGHMDMVLEKNSCVTTDLATQPIRLVLDGDELHADGTTLGADDGIAVAMMLAVLADKTLKHPPLECVFTTDEEIGMLGADALDVSVLKGKRMINLDSEEEGVFTVGCAGGAEEHFTFTFERKPRYGMVLHLQISGLAGGHSGACIHLGRANADLLMGRLLAKIDRKVKCSLLSVSGGTKDNAIPRECDAQLIFDDGAAIKEVISIIDKFTDQIRREYQVTDPDVQITCDWTDQTELPVPALSREDTKRILNFLMLIPNGLVESDPLIKDMPQTSLNLGIVSTDTDTFRAVSLVRSSINSQKKYLMQRLKCLAKVLSMDLETKGEYPAWERARHSELCGILAGIYKEQYHKEPEISVTHGGLECGLIAAKVSGGLDCVSIGPDMSGIHTPSEKISLSSTQRLWQFLTAALPSLCDR